MRRDVIGRESGLYSAFWCDYTNFHLFTLKGLWRGDLLVCLPSERRALGAKFCFFFFFWCLPFLYTNQSSFKMTTLNTFPSGLIWLPLWWLPGAGRRQPPCSSGSGWRGWGWRRWLPRLGGCLLFWIDSTGCDDQRWASGHLEQRGSQDTVEVLKDK